LEWSSISAGIKNWTEKLAALEVWDDDQEVSIHLVIKTLFYLILIKVKPKHFSSGSWPFLALSYSQHI
jgi:hypothetical protein